MYTPNCALHFLSLQMLRPTPTGPPGGKDGQEPRLAPT